jgi:hypothetical protein
VTKFSFQFLCSSSHGSSHLLISALDAPNGGQERYLERSGHLMKVECNIIP